MQSFVSEKAPHLAFWWHDKPSFLHRIDDGIGVDLPLVYQVDKADLVLNTLLYYLHVLLLLSELGSEGTSLLFVFCLSSHICLNLIHFCLHLTCLFWFVKSFEVSVKTP